MKTLPAGMQAHLDTGTTTLCWCWKVVRGDGVSLGFTDHDESVDFDGVIFEASTGFTASELRSSLGLSVDNTDVEGALSSNQITESDISAGLYDDANVEVWRVNWSEPGQRVLMRNGNLGEISRGETFFNAEVRGLAHKLQQPQGRIFQRSCDADLGDNRCGVDTGNSAYRGLGAVANIVSADTIEVSGVSAFDDGWFTAGVMQFLTGDNSGRSYPLRYHGSDSAVVIVSTWQSITFPMAINDSVELVAGCDKRISTCIGKFSNAQNFRGFPHMPGNDFVLQYPNKGDAGLDGNRRFSTF